MNIYLTNFTGVYTPNQLHKGYIYFLATIQRGIYILNIPKPTIHGVFILVDHEKNVFKISKCGEG